MVHQDASTVREKRAVGIQWEELFHDRAYPKVRNRCRRGFRSESKVCSGSFGFSRIGGR